MYIFGAKKETNIYMGNNNYNLKFESAEPQDTLIMIYDLANFSNLFSHPDVGNFMPDYLNIIRRAINVIILGGETWWVEEKTIIPKIAEPVHYKYLGDGGLYIFNKKDIVKVDYFINRMYNFKASFPYLLRYLADAVPIIEIPKFIRIGLTTGTVYRMKYEGIEEYEYTGYQINLAARLQGYCKNLGFMASARLRVSNEYLEKNGYIKVIAKKIKGHHDEIVIVDKEEFENLSNEEREILFAPYQI